MCMCSPLCGPEQYQHFCSNCWEDSLQSCGFLWPLFEPHSQCVGSIVRLKMCICQSWKSYSPFKEGGLILFEKREKSKANKDIPGALAAAFAVLRYLCRFPPSENDITYLSKSLFSLVLLPTHHIHFLRAEIPFYTKDSRDATLSLRQHPYP